MKTNNLLSHRKQEPERSVLYVVGTPIGNLDDISFRALNILKKVSLIACEDTRKTGALIKHFKISNKLISFHKYNANERSDFIISKLKEGETIALVSDAGMPLISDPGENIVKKARENDLDVICIPGPCAALAGIVSSGLNTNKFTFYGFLPRKKKERLSLLKEINNSSITSIVYESPKRILKLLNDLKELSGGERDIVLLKEITKRYEKHFNNNIENVIKEIETSDPKGEYTLIISGSFKNVISENIGTLKIKNELIDLIEAGLSHSSAASYLSKKTGQSKNKIYNMITKSHIE